MTVRFVLTQGQVDLAEADSLEGAVLAIRTMVGEGQVSLVAAPVLVIRKTQMPAGVTHGAYVAKFSVSAHGTLTADFGRL